MYYVYSVFVWTNPLIRRVDTAWTKPLEKAQFYKLRLKTGKG